MRVKLIGVSDEARKSESVTERSNDYPPPQKALIFIVGAKLTWHAQWFDDSFVENKLPPPNISQASKKR
jgi:hypothetical protein